MYLKCNCLSFDVATLWLQQKHGTDRQLDDFEQLTVLQSFLDKPGIYLREVQEELYDTTGKWASCATICRTVLNVLA